MITGFFIGAIDVDDIRERFNVHSNMQLNDNFVRSMFPFNVIIKHQILYVTEITMRFKLESFLNRRINLIMDRFNNNFI